MSSAWYFVLIAALVLAVLTTGCSLRIGNPPACVHQHLPDGSIMTFCSPNIKCTTSKDASGEMTICEFPKP